MTWGNVLLINKQLALSASKLLLILLEQSQHKILMKLERSEYGSLVTLLPFKIHWLSIVFSGFRTSCSFKIVF